MRLRLPMGREAQPQESFRTYGKAKPFRTSGGKAEATYAREAAIAASKISNATSTFSFDRISGGDQRIVFAPAPRMISPRSKQAISTRSRNSGAALFPA